MEQLLSNRRNKAVLPLFVCVAGALVAAVSIAAKPPQSTAREKWAAGEYELVRPLRGNQGIGPFSAAISHFRESFTLWRLADGTLEAEGRRTYESPEGEPHDNKFTVHLSSDLRAIGVTEFRKLRFRPDSGPLKCSFLEREFDCTSGKRADDPKLNLATHTDYGLLWPVSAFCLGSVAVNAPRDPARETHVELVAVDEPSREEPIAANLLDTTLKFLRTQKIHVAGTDWQADEFEMKVPLQQPFLLWTSSKRKNLDDALLLLFGPEGDSTSGPENGLQLVHYEYFGHMDRNE